MTCRRRTDRAARRAPRALAALLVGLAALAAAASPGLASGAPSAATLLAAYNARSLGSPGWRRVNLELRTGSQVTRSLSVIEWWRRSEVANTAPPEGAGEPTVSEEIRSVFTLTSPPALRGTSYLLIERPRGLEIRLVLPTSADRVLTVEPSRFAEGLLGSDFGYRDVAWRIVTAEHTVRLLGRSRLDGVPVWAVELVRDSAADGGGGARRSAWAREVHSFAIDPPADDAPRLLLGSDLYREGEAHPARRIRYYGWHLRDGVFTPSRIVSSGLEGRSSSLTLEAFHVGGSPLADPVFEPDGLSAVARAVRDEDWSFAAPSHVEGARP